MASDESSSSSSSHPTEAGDDSRPPMPPSKSVPNMATSQGKDEETESGALLSMESSEHNLDERQAYLRKLYVEDEEEEEDGGKDVVEEGGLDALLEKALTEKKSLFEGIAIDKDKSFQHADSTESGRRDTWELFLDVGFEECKEESTPSEEETSRTMNRKPLLQQFTAAMVEFGYVKRLNNYLHKKMAEYFKKRKMDHVLIEVEHSEDTQIKYGKKLDNFASLIEFDDNQRSAINSEMMELQTLRDTQCSTAQEMFAALSKRQQEIGVGLISTKTGKELPEKFIEKLMNNQKNKAKELQQLRLIHIKIRNAVVEKNAQIRALDKIGENYTLMEYEQLKSENQGHMDKIEERDDELSRLRKKCRGAIQCLAHVREKCSNLEHNIQKMREVLAEREAENVKVREKVNQLKQLRDWYRSETQRLKEENGLLTKDKLLIDMEEALKTIEELKEQTSAKSQSLLLQKRKLHSIRMNYDNEVRKRQLQNINKTTDKSERKIIKIKRGKQHFNKGIYLSEKASKFQPNYEKQSKFEEI